MNIWDYVQKYNNSMSGKKRKQLRRKIIRKLARIQPRILEAKLLSLSESNKIYRYKTKLEATLNVLNNNPDTEVIIHTVDVTTSGLISLP